MSNSGKRPGGKSSGPVAKRPRLVKTANPNGRGKSKTATKSTSKSQGDRDTKLKFKSPAEFFAENKNIAGFDNPGKSLYTTIRELVENGLDAAEAIGTLPDIEIFVARIDKQQFRTMVGMDGNRNRVDASLYKDVESVKERKAREAKEKREAKRTKSKDGSLSASGSGQLQTDNDDANDSKELTLESTQEASQPSQTSSKKGKSGGNDIFCVTVTDNGSGMAHDDVPNMMGRVLAGTKYCVRQTRGKFGLGSKMALIWSKMSTGLPVRINTAKAGSEVTNCILDIDIARNIPNVIELSRKENPSGWRGSKVSVTIEGNWSTYRAKILLYVRQMAVITPYAQFRLTFSSGYDNADSKDFELVFSRRTDKMPRTAAEVKHHPSSVNQLLLKQLIGDVKEDMSLVRFLTTQFVAIPRSLATRLITELGKGFTQHMTVGELTLNNIRQIDALLHAARFENPDGLCLSPAGEYNLRLGITKELKPSMVATHAEPADVFEGHPFIVEAGVALGGTGMKPGLNIFRFANRIPLLFEAGNDVVTRTARDGIRWNSYKISPNTDRIGVICSIVSTKVPFKGTGKEYIGDDSDSIKLCVKRAITQCCLQLKTKLVRQAAQKDAAQRKMLITKYAPDVANAVVALFEELEDPDRETKDVSDSVLNGKISRDILLAKLQDHVQQFDKEQAIEYATAHGRDHKTLETVFIARRSEQINYSPIWLEQPRATSTPEGSQQESAPVVRFSLLSSLQSHL
ncbi:Type II DNA topoisomerase VI subunit B [Chondrus crispus]|uniref:Type II DNA topoisomerase VI subunit B n=1 Tax=Chondrus crispus TaxID=2769 RepID=R7QF50_CHOCR|nr:Type II DNA topoisomerase VI subunit B [Chondrus crispus]CDF36719.1 Type II DNA topoisomerase VI subunit B [Chondrus crispus]|eukprot:XP_005716538.1 Type II DNA topoisomerase VI subunit B [Chondrus crispus]